MYIIYTYIKPLFNQLVVVDLYAAVCPVHCKLPKGLMTITFF